MSGYILERPTAGQLIDFITQLEPRDGDLKKHPIINELRRVPEKLRPTRDEMLRAMRKLRNADRGDLADCLDALSAEWGVFKSSGRPPPKAGVKRLYSVQNQPEPNHPLLFVRAPTSGVFPDIGIGDKLELWFRPDTIVIQRPFK